MKRNDNHLFDIFLAFSPGSGHIVPVENGLVAREVLWPLHASDLLTIFHQVAELRVIADIRCTARMPNDFVDVGVK